MKMKMKNESRTSRMKSVGVLGNIRGLGASISSMDYNDDEAYCYCPEATRMVDESQTNGCLSGNNNSAYCIEFRKVLIKVYEGCIDKQENEADRFACEVGIETTY
jgi:hypothetical protein